MMETLISGFSASQLFRSIHQENPLIDARKLAEIMMYEFPEISPAAAISIYKWFNVKNANDFPDAQIDALIFHFLKEAGYTT